MTEENQNEDKERREIADANRRTIRGYLTKAYSRHVDERAIDCMTELMFELENYDKLRLDLARIIEFYGGEDRSGIAKSRCEHRADGRVSRDFVEWSRNTLSNLYNLGFAVGYKAAENKFGRKTR